MGLPPSVTPGQLAGGLALGVVAALYIATRFVSLKVLMLVACAAYWGIKTESGSGLLARGTSQLSATLRRPVPRHVPLLLICLSIGFVGHILLDGSSGAARGAASVAGKSTRDAEFSTAIREAYDQGYEDGSAGLERRP